MSAATSKSKDTQKLSSKIRAPAIVSKTTKQAINKPNNKLLQKSPSKVTTSKHTPGNQADFDLLDESETAVIFPSTSITLQDRILKLLRRPEGASLANLIELTGWQAHSIRGFISGTLRKKRGLHVVHERSPDGDRNYKIVAIA